MYATIELTDEIIGLINTYKNKSESFDEIVELVFSKNMKKNTYTLSEQLNYIFTFNKIKSSAFNKALSHKKLNYPEGIVLDRLLSLYAGEEIISYDEYLKNIHENCTNSKSKKSITNLFKILRGE